MRFHLQVLVISGLLAATTLIAYFGFNLMGITGIVMLYLAAVLLASYYLALPVALSGAVSAFLAINYFFVEPRYTFEVAHIESWVALSGFLLVSVVVTSLVKRLQQQTTQANLERGRAQFSKQLAEHLASCDDAQDLLQSSCTLIHDNIKKPVAIAHINADDKLELIARSASIDLAVDEGAVRWAMQNGKTMGPATTNWPESELCLIPFGRLPGNLPVLVIGGVPEQGEEELQYLRAITDQVSIAYQRIISVEHAHRAELLAREESLRNSLLSSLSHDMRTPLTAILGAATTLAQQGLGEPEQATLLESICSEATYLAKATENILSLAQLNARHTASEDQQLALDWQLPEEIIGTILARYRGRELPCQFVAEIADANVFIKADASLLAQALANLIDNAIAVHRGTEPVVVRVEVSGEILEIKVKDKGPGFPPGFTISQIRKFSRRSSKGFGLGLAIVQAIAEVHQATFNIEARSGGGAVVTLGFPIQHMDAGHD